MRQPRSMAADVMAAPAMRSVAADAVRAPAAVRLRREEAGGEERRDEEDAAAHARLPPCPASTGRFCAGAVHSTAVNVSVIV